MILRMNKLRGPKKMFLTKKEEEDVGGKKKTVYAKTLWLKWAGRSQGIKVNVVKSKNQGGRPETSRAARSQTTGDFWLL